MAAKVKRDEKGIYWVVVHHKGRRKKKRIGRSKRTAEHVAAQIQAQLALGQFAIVDAEREPIPFDAFSQDWLRREIEIPIDREMKGHHAPGTARIYRLQVDVHLTPYFRDLDIRSIGLREVQGFHEHCIDTGRPRSSKSIDMALNVLRLILSHARGQGIIETNAVESWKAGRPGIFRHPWSWRTGCAAPSPASSHSEKPPLVWHTLEAMRATVLELQARSCHQVLHGAGY